MNDETLLLYYHNELPAYERRELEAALSADSALQERYDALRSDLDQLRHPEAVAAPADMLARFHRTIDQAAMLEGQRMPEKKPPFDWRSFAWGSIVAAALVLGIGFALFFSDERMPAEIINPDSTVVDTTPPATTGSPFTRGLQVHFAQSRQDISNLSLDEQAERQMLIMHIIQQNRLFAREANENASPELARVLRAFEPILMRLSADDISAEEAARLQTKLQFELNAMLTKLGTPASDRRNTGTNNRAESI